MGRDRALPLSSFFFQTCFTFHLSQQTESLEQATAWEERACNMLVATGFPFHLFCHVACALHIHIYKFTCICYHCTEAEH